MSAEKTVQKCVELCSIWLPFSIWTSLSWSLPSSLHQILAKYTLDLSSISLVSALLNWWYVYILDEIVSDCFRVTFKWVMSLIKISNNSENPLFLSAPSWMLPFWLLNLPSKFLFKVFWLTQDIAKD